MLCSSVELRYWWIYYLWRVKAAITTNHRGKTRSVNAINCVNFEIKILPRFPRGVLIALLPLLCQLRNSLLVCCHKQFILHKWEGKNKIEKLYIFKIQTLPQIVQKDLSEYHRLFQLFGSWCHFLHVLDLSCLFMMRWSLSFSSNGPAKTWNTNSMPYIDAQPCASETSSCDSEAFWTHRVGRVQQRRWNRCLVEFFPSSSHFGCRNRHSFRRRRTPATPPHDAFSCEGQTLCETQAAAVPSAGGGENNGGFTRSLLLDWDSATSILCTSTFSTTTTAG